MVSGLPYIKRGFTLLELLITTLVIAGLTLASFPTLSKSEKVQSHRSYFITLKNCFYQGRVLAKSPRTSSTSSIVVRYLNGTNKGCELIERYSNGSPDKIVEQYYLFPADRYTVTMEYMGVVGNPVDIVIPTEPPYIPGTGNMKINFTSVGGTSSFTINLDTATLITST